jgi:hypothetical protein
MKIINGKPFDFVSSLHNMAFGFGITFQVSEPCPLLCAPFQKLAKDNGIFLRKRVGFMLTPRVQLGKHLTPVNNCIGFRAEEKSPLRQVAGAYVLEYVRLTNPLCFMMTPELTP